jgi:hypothetical protein
MAPSNKKGMFLKLWRGLIFGFMLLWLARVFMNMKTLSKWQTEALTKYQTNVHLSWFLKKLRTFIETALAWLAYEDVAFPQNWAFFMSQHKLCLIYFCIILPFWMLGLSISFINMYMQITLNGQLDLEEGLFRRRDLRKRRQQERLALLTHNASEEIT